MGAFLLLVLPYARLSVCIRAPAPMPLAWPGQPPGAALTCNNHRIASTPLVTPCGPLNCDVTSIAPARVVEPAVHRHGLTRSWLTAR